MKTKLIIALGTTLLTLGACSQAEAPKGAVVDMVKTVSTVGDAKTAAVLVYADWCGSCKALDPKIEKVHAMGDIPGLAFITLDYTDKDADNFYAQAKAAGVHDAVQTYLDGKIKTGMLLLVDVDDGKVIGKVTKELEPNEIVSALKDALAAS